MSPVKRSPRLLKVVYVASDEELARNIADFLSLHGFLCCFRPAGSLDGAFEILVPVSEAPEAQDAIFQYLSRRRGMGSWP